MADQANDEQDFGALLAEFEAGTGDRRDRKVKIGEKVQGTIVAVGEDNVFVDVGTKAEASLALDEVRDDEGEITVAVGDEIEALVVTLDRETGAPVLRLKAGRGAAAAEELRQAYAARVPVEGTVTGVNKGGVEVETAGLRAFCPISQLDSHYVDQPEAYLGRKLTFRITRFEDSGRTPNVVLSRRVLLEEEAKARAEETRRTLEVGKIVEGTVTSLTNYGAFIDLGGLEGLLHVSEISHQRVAHPEQVLEVGQPVRVEILRIEPGKDGTERISLSRKALDADPWDGVAERFPEDRRLRGRVVRLAPFGAFVEVAPGVDGLLHISELGGGRRLAHPKEAVTVGDELDVKVLSVDPERKRLSLTVDRNGEEGIEEAGESEESQTEASRPAQRQPSRQDAGPSGAPSTGSSGGGFAALGDVLQGLKENLEKRENEA
ncbi:MAG: S1 RNA-binding domain-containing protein [Acidobacteriota bacterium]|nr:S1 RNA-binding domain-containing protein [Acidobacteriota bacterium]